jgi:hypothetical protein
MIDALTLVAFNLLTYLFFGALGLAFIVGLASVLVELWGGP